MDFEEQSAHIEMLSIMSEISNALENTQVIRNMWIAPHNCPKEVDISFN